MAHLPCIELSAADARALLGIARQSIRHGLSMGSTLDVDTGSLPASLGATVGVFVTLTRDGKLRGCIGSLSPASPLAQEVADAAYGAAFDDPRFPGLLRRELEGLAIEISLLSEMVPLAVSSREQLLATLRPGEDGLLLEDGRRRSTFLPKVWEQLPSPEAFVEQLLAKAGLPVNHWSATLRLHRYTAVCLSEEKPPAAGLT